jgi:hypothetical protein
MHSAIRWLLGLKGVYLALVFGAVWFWNDFDTEKFYAVNARWPRESGPVFASHFATWDAAHYLYLSEVGYDAGVPSCAFYPLWPLLVRGFAPLMGRSHVLAGLVLANASSLAAWMLFHRSVARRWGESAANWALVFLIAFPGALFFQFNYTESLFLLLVMLLWWGLERQHYGLVWVAAGLLPLSRGVGVFAVLPIAWRLLTKKSPEWLVKLVSRWPWLQERGRVESRGTREKCESGSGGCADTSATEAGLAVPHRQPPHPGSLPLGGGEGDRTAGVSAGESGEQDGGQSGDRADPVFRHWGWREYALLLAPLVGWAVYLGLMWHWTGNPLEGIQAQKHWRVHSISNLWNVPKFVVGFFTPTEWHAFRGSVLDRSVFMLLLYTLPVVWRLDKGLLVWAYLLGILPAMSGTFTSFTRFASCAFPMFIALGVFLGRREWRWPRYALLTVFVTLHLVLVWRFVNFRWAG